METHGNIMETHGNTWKHHGNTWKHHGNTWKHHGNIMEKMWKLLRDCFHLRSPRRRKGYHHRDARAITAETRRAQRELKIQEDRQDSHDLEIAVSINFANLVQQSLSLRPLRLCGGSVVFPHSLAHSERPCKKATRNGVQKRR